MPVVAATDSGGASARARAGAASPAASPAPKARRVIDSVIVMDIPACN
jgi:hypothetical protein